jgi:uncharacterized protein
VGDIDKTKIYSIEDIRNILKSNESTLRDKFKAVKFYLFGSYARGEQTAESDIDLLVETDKSMDMFEFVNLKYYLEELFGKNVDLGTPTSIKSFVKDRILKEAVAL